MSFALPTVTSCEDAALAARLRQALDNKTKPLHSLGQLEHLAVRLGLILRSEKPALHDPQLVVFAADHGLTAHGVSAFPSDVTWQMVENFLAGGAAVSVLARQQGIALTVVDCGVKHTFAPRPGLIVRKTAEGSNDSLSGPAMTLEQCQICLQHGSELVQSLTGNALLLGEMGIGNTSAAALLMARYTGHPIVACTGAGAGLDAAGINHKTHILTQVLAKHQGVSAPLAVLAALGGLEIATMVGAILQAAALGRVVVVDGFITTAAVLAARALQPQVVSHCVFSHRSGERGHSLMLDTLQAQPLLSLGLRLGEGSGAALAWPILPAACAIVSDMASFESAGVSRQGG